MTVLLKTERLTLRRFTPSDVDHLFALDNDPDVMRYLNGGIPTSRAVIENDLLPKFLTYNEKQPGFGFWAVELSKSGDFLGWISLRPTHDGADEATLGYRFCKAAWGHGYATEGCRALLSKAFAEMNIKRILATTYQDNIGSQRVMEKLGMTLVRRFRLSSDELSASDTTHMDADDLWDGDDLEYALEKSEWMTV